MIRYRVHWPLLSRLRKGIPDLWSAWKDPDDGIEDLFFLSAIFVVIGALIGLGIVGLYDTGPHGQLYVFNADGHICTDGWVFLGFCAPLIAWLTWIASYVVAGALWVLAHAPRWLAKSILFCLPRVERESLLDREKIAQLERDLLEEDRKTAIKERARIEIPELRKQAQTSIDKLREMSKNG